MQLLVHPSVEAYMSTLKNQAGGTLLLYGPQGIGKRSMAVEIARQLNCAGCSDESCRSCHMIAAGNHSLVVWVNPDEKGKIGIGQIQELQHELHYEQYEHAGKRVVIIAGADTMTLPAQNAILKTLEEPPLNTTIILTAVSTTALLPTVLSRCSSIYMPPVAVEALISHLGKHYSERSADVATAVSVSGGLPGKAISYLEDPASLVQDVAAIEETRALVSNPELFERLCQAAKMASATDRQQSYVDMLTAAARQAARAGSGGGVLAAVEHLRQRLQANVSPKTAFEALAVELA